MFCIFPPDSFYFKSISSEGFCLTEPQVRRLKPQFTYYVTGYGESWFANVVYKKKLYFADCVTGSLYDPQSLECLTGSLKLHG